MPTLTVIDTPTEALSRAQACGYTKDGKRIKNTFDAAQQLPPDHTTTAAPGTPGEHLYQLRGAFYNRFRGETVAIYSGGKVVVGSPPSLLRQSTTETSTYYGVNYATDSAISESADLLTFLKTQTAINALGGRFYKVEKKKLRIQLQLPTPPEQPDKHTTHYSLPELNNFTTWFKFRQKLHEINFLGTIKTTTQNTSDYNTEYNYCWALLGDASVAFLNTAPWRDDPNWLATTTQTAWTSQDPTTLLQTDSHPNPAEPLHAPNANHEKASISDLALCHWQEWNQYPLLQHIVAHRQTGNSLRHATSNILASFLQPINSLPAHIAEHNKNVANLAGQIWLMIPEEVFSLTWEQYLRKPLHKVFDTYHYSFRTNANQIVIPDCLQQGTAQEILDHIKRGDFLKEKPWSKLLLSLL